MGLVPFFGGGINDSCGSEGELFAITDSPYPKIRRSGVIRFARGCIQVPSPSPLQNPLRSPYNGFMSTPFPFLDVLAPYLVILGLTVGVAWQQMPPSLTAIKLEIPPDDTALITDIISNEANGLIVTERRGRVLEVIPSHPPQVRVIADLQEQVWGDYAEYGMYSVALSPDYPTNRWFYLSFSNREGDLEIGRYREQDARYETILVVPQPQTGDPLIDSTHKGGQLAFRDGYLYIATGDGGTRQPPQDNPAYDPASLLGKILRIEVERNENVPYTIPADNPFVNEPSARGEVWAVGFRNPWKFTFDEGTGDMYVSDVGDAGFEEINWIGNGEKGLDFGWNCNEGTTVYYEGDYCQNRQSISPIYSYPTHQTVEGRTHCAITGGEVLRDYRYPALHGSYVYGDVCAARLYQLQPIEGEWVSSVLYNFENLQEDLITAIGMHNGILYVANHKGDIYEMRSR